MSKATVETNALSHTFLDSGTAASMLAAPAPAKPPLLTDKFLHVEKNSLALKTRTHTSSVPTSPKSSFH